MFEQTLFCTTGADQSESGSAAADQDETVNQGASGSGIAEHSSSCSTSTIAEAKSTGSEVVEPGAAEPTPEGEETVVVIVVAEDGDDAGSVSQKDLQHALENEDVLSSGEAVLE